MNDQPPYNNDNNTVNTSIHADTPSSIVSSDDHPHQADDTNYLATDTSLEKPVLDSDQTIDNPATQLPLQGHSHPALNGAKSEISKEAGYFKLLNTALVGEYQKFLDALLTDEDKEELGKYNAQFAKLVHSGKTEQEAIDQLTLPVDKDKVHRYSTVADNASLLMAEESTLKSIYNSGDVYHAIEDDEGGLIAQVSPKTKPVESITTAKQLLAALTAAGFKSTRHLPMWASGIRLDISTPDDTVLAGCLERTVEAKTTYGNDTAGYYFSTDMVFTLTSLARLAFQNTYASNIKGLGDLDVEARVEKLMSLVPITEINHLLQGLGYTLHPKGFPVDVICTNPKCNTETTYNQNVGYMAYHFKSKLPTDLVRRMRKHRNAIDEAEVLKYRSDMIENIPSRTLHIELENGKKITVVFKIPSIAEYERSSIYWIESIVDHVDQTIGESFVSEADRDRRIASRINYETLNRYIPYIDKINIGESVMDSSLVDPDKVRDVLASLSEYSDLQESIVVGILTFIADATPTVIGMPLPRCPACGEDNSNTSVHTDNLMVIDPVNLFLALREWKLSRGRNILMQKAQNS